MDDEDNNGYNVEADDLSEASSDESDESGSEWSEDSGYETLENDINYMDEEDDDIGENEIPESSDSEEEENEIYVWEYNASGSSESEEENNDEVDEPVLLHWSEIHFESDHKVNNLRKLVLLRQHEIATAMYEKKQKSRGLLDNIFGKKTRSMLETSQPLQMLVIVQFLEGT